MKKQIVLSIVLIFAIASSAFAGQYVGGKLGIYFPDESAFDNGYNIEAVYGRDFNDLFPGAAQHNSWLRNVALEAGIAYYNADFSRRASGFGIVPDSRVKGELSVVPLTLTGVYNHRLSGTDLNLFGGAGFGLYFSEVEVKVDGFREDDSGVELGMRLVGGAEYPITPEFSLGAELRVDLVTDEVGGAFLNFGGKYRF